MLLRAFIVGKVGVGVVVCLISLRMKCFELILHDPGQVIVDVIVRRTRLVIEESRPGNDISMLPEHGALQLYCPIRGQYSGHVISIVQSE